MILASHLLGSGKYAPLVAVKEFNGINSLTVEINGEWIAYDLTKEEAKTVFHTAVLALEKIGFTVGREGESFLK